MIGAYVKVGEGVRISNSILLADSTVQPHCCILNAVIGWTRLISCWSRIEGIYDAKSQKATTTHLGGIRKKKIGDETETITFGKGSVEQILNELDGEAIYHR